MSKSIWHKLPSQPEEDRLIVVKSKRTGEYLVGNEFEFILDNFTKWAYFDDLLALETENKNISDEIGKLETELEKTRKALDVAVDALNRIDKQLMTGIEMTSQARNALEQITALEQKDK
jgi:hypothetical protein